MDAGMLMVMPLGPVLMATLGRLAVERRKAQKKQAGSVLMA
tara:strand:+ start:35 stop:157 length:123 start_codon:yes stop_codon:yes gene_type:complete